MNNEQALDDRGVEELRADVLTRLQALLLHQELPPAAAEALRRAMECEQYTLSAE